MTTIKDILHDCDTRMAKAIESLRNELAKIRTGRATTALLDTVHVEAYGSEVPIAQVGNINVSDAHSLSVQVWDKGLMGAVEKAIRNANLGLNPVNDGQVIRVPLPPLTEERRKEIVKLVKKFGEETKVSVRNVRRDSMEHLKKAEKDQHFSEDERKRGEEEVQKKTDAKVKETDSIISIKEKEVMAV
ncbi:MAG: ribosome recycling factor [Bacteroidota bacterium]|nr:ribosome recycling factor [Bacteroidota bacterium]MDP4233890.1 ribosome recycling factor [Bacteroidota bacterium]MDP4243562.1 ribosome recycling factor [Bacteroidota bacterium]MDP4288898.1 ribosome recycling factor [Bacteroidota bacterium]